MIVVRAPMRISFVGGGTDLPEFYKRHGGMVISATIDKFVYVVINGTPLIDKISARYTKSETVDHPSKLQNDRIREALLDMRVKNGVEFGSFASLPGRTGLGSSSSFSVALMKGLHAYLGSKIDKVGAAEAASRLEIELLGEPIGKQDQYAASFGGFNVFEFKKDGTVNVEPIPLGYKTRLALEKQMLVFFTGISRDASKVLSKQRDNIKERSETLKEMAESVPDFTAKLLAEDFKGMAGMLHEGWLRKKSLANNVSSRTIDELYKTGIDSGAWGGKLLGAGAGGCVLFVAPRRRHTQIKEAMAEAAIKKKLTEFREIPIKFVQSGTEVLLNTERSF
jgi:D-glycero-alpha-D-manno-heptose-7-phosphate kinase